MEMIRFDSIDLADTKFAAAISSFEVMLVSSSYVWIPLIFGSMICLARL